MKDKREINKCKRQTTLHVNFKIWKISLPDPNTKTNHRLERVLKRGQIMDLSEAV